MGWTKGTCSGYMSLERKKKKYDSSNSLFSLPESSYLNLSMDEKLYYLENDEIHDSTSNSNLYCQNFPADDALLNMQSSTGKKIDKYVVILVGLPAVGKSTVANHLIQYLAQNVSTKNLRCKIFNAGNIRRKLNTTMTLANNSAEDLFNPKNSDKKAVYAKIAFDNIINDINDNICDLAIFDATNSTKKRRNLIYDQISQFNNNNNNTTNFNLCPIVLQITCSDKNFIKFNIHNKTFNEDYFNQPYESSIRDFSKRLYQYHSQFVPYTVEEFDSTSQNLFTDTNCFYFHLFNIGLSESINKTSLCETISRQTTLLFYVFQNFIKNYAILFGSKYMSNVKDFYNVPKVISNNNFKVLKSVEHIQRLKILSEIVNQVYFMNLDKSPAFEPLH